MSHIVFIHRHGPGQFVHLARHLAQLGHKVTLLCETSETSIPGTRVIKHRSVNPGHFDGTAPAYQLRLGQEVAKVLDTLRRTEGAPDIIMGHGGWGSLLFAKDIFPQTPLVAYCEFFYQAKGADIGFDPATPPQFSDIAKLKGRNFAQLATLPTVDAGVSPTHWQRSLFPKAAQANIGVVHDGIDLTFCRPDPQARLTLPNGRVVAAGERIVTYAARNLEPYRGFPQFMRAAAALARRDRRVTFLVAGADGTSYGPGPASGGSWRQQMMAETGLDPSRIHFLGTLPHADLIRLFAVSAAHVYLTYPFVLSWSMLEAMASGALVIGSQTPPVQEFVDQGRSGLLVPFFDADALVDAMRHALDGAAAMTQMRAAARATIERRAGLEDSLRRQVLSLRQLAGRRRLAG